MKLAVGDYVLIARRGYYPLLIRARVRVVGCSHERVVAHCYTASIDNIRIDQCDEGVTWCYGYDRDSKAAAALIVSMAL